ncbi:twin-arginine translocase TatA/TatE family subunit [Bartonella ancashensis]|uniref:Sec-independent protein translocase protein TatA n=1 Tax=Bartonella ancashensis TaxID=1318743 RepID=A0A0M3T368_9HYPH|nr:twin-arginine translocase TatA/TatE family subunit [Bartonella ancashensis]ALE03955.1 Twin-arginine translocation protein TatA [Bartonella ancashensis]
MGNIFSPTHLIVIFLVILILFGRGKVSDLMGDVAKGIKAFKKNLKDEEDSLDNELEIAKSSERVDSKFQGSHFSSAKRATSTKKVSSLSKSGKGSASKR